MARRHTEEDLQAAVVFHLKIRGALGMVWWHTPNAPRNAVMGARLKAMGMRSGVADLVLFHNEKLYCLELKSPGKRATEKQLRFLTDIGEAGAFTCVCDNLDAALRVLKSWNLIVGE